MKVNLPGTGKTTDKQLRKLEVNLPVQITLDINTWESWKLTYLVRPVARGGSGGSYDPPPQLPIPKILFHPLAILLHLSAILFHPLAILSHPSAILFHPLAILFHPSAILFHPWNMWMWMTSHGQCPRGGCLWMSKSGGIFQIDDVTRAMSKGGGGGAPGVPPIQVQTPPTWLAGYGPAGTGKTTDKQLRKLKVNLPMYSPFPWP